MESPRISVIVPVYNAEKYLHRCIDSILAQTFTDFELLLIDDGSKDRSGAICDEYAKKDSRVRVFHKENGGVSSARNVGLDEAIGEWILFVDPDDYIIYDDSLETLLDTAIHNNVKIVRGEYIAVDKDEKELFKSPQKSQRAIYANQLLDEVTFIHKIFFNENFLWLCLIHKKYINCIRFNENRIFLEDAEFYYTLLSQPAKCYYITKEFYAYRKHESAVTNKEDPRKLRDAANFTTFLMEMSKRKDIKKTFKIACLQSAIANYKYDIYEISVIDDSRKRKELLNKWDFTKQPYMIAKSIILIPKLWFNLAFCLPSSMLIYINRLRTLIRTIWQRN